MSRFLLVSTIALAAFVCTANHSGAHNPDARSDYKVFVRNVGVVSVQTEYANDYRRELFGLQKCAWEEDGSHSGCQPRARRK